MQVSNLNRGLGNFHRNVTPKLIWIIPRMPEFDIGIIIIFRWNNITEVTIMIMVSGIDSRNGLVQYVNPVCSII